ncbi:hypothetical protein [Pseudochryseolinea flava]|nr:hypothetical protein [Pseudochryseolinea flava]
MNKIKLYQFYFPAMLIAGVIGCNRHEAPMHASLEIPSISFASNLRDFIPEKSLQLLKYNGNIVGEKIAHPGVGYVSYFDYQASESDVLTMLATLPFSKYAMVADTTAYKIDLRFLELERTQVTAEEMETAFDFWNATADEYTAYECRKFPWKHTVLVNNRTRRVLHRIEYKLS